MKCVRAALSLFLFFSLSVWLVAEQSSGFLLISHNDLLTVMGALSEQQVLSQNRETQLTILQNLIDDNLIELTGLKEITLSQGEYLNQLLAQTEQLREISQEQSRLLKQSLQRQKFWKWTAIIGIPTIGISMFALGVTR